MIPTGAMTVQFKADIESLDGMHPFVAARILRLSFDVHALPADDQLSALLHEHGVIDEPVDPEGEPGVGRRAGVTAPSPSTRRCGLKFTSACIVAGRQRRSLAASDVTTLICP